jgi:hypothetical protein
MSAADGVEKRRGGEVINSFSSTTECREPLVHEPNLGLSRRQQIKGRQ